MKKILLCLLVIVAAWVAQSCVTQKLANDYQQKTHWTDSDRNFTESFDKAVELLIDMGYELKGVNRENGVIQFNTSIPSKKIWIERKEKTPPPVAYLVIPEGSSAYVSASVMITILVRATDKGSVIGVRSVPYYLGYKNVVYYSQIATTGVLEKELLLSLSEPSVYFKR